MRNLLFQLTLMIAGGLFIKCTPEPSDSGKDVLFESFRNPPSEAKPFVRWWWNGNYLDKDEIIRELDILKASGFGGVELNPIALPEEAEAVNGKPMEWLSPQWNKMLQFTAGEVKQRGMIADMIVGSGWPFGGEFLRQDETVQRVIIHELPCSGGETFDVGLNTLIAKAVNVQRHPEMSESVTNELMFLKLVPDSIDKVSEIMDLTNIVSGGRLTFKVPEGSYQLIYGIRQKSHRDVMLGALGAAGPVMNHLDQQVVRAYLNRLTRISDDTGVPLNQLVRALFCDSIELLGANWTNNFGEIFYDTYQYRIEPYYPFVFYESYTGYQPNKYPASFTEEIRRVRYDYNKLLVQVFLDNFTKTFQKFCTENGVLCRYQAYGTPFLLGMMEGNMIPDIPESNNWIYTNDMEADAWNWNQGHGYMIWNLFAASGGHLMDRKIISTEAITNTKGVFKTTLEEIKQHDDMNFITGINHSVVHGYNYSPPEAGFPGWVRFGTYFSEQNTWWPYIKKWTDYNARLSQVFQNSKPEKQMAILGPTSDLWGSTGLTRKPFHMEPWYCYRLWEPLSQAGSSCDYISEDIIQRSDKSEGVLQFGPMSYRVIVLCDVSSMEPGTALALEEFVANGGQLVLIDQVPKRSLSYQQAIRNDSIVSSVFDNLTNKHADRVFIRNSPSEEKDLLPWASALLSDLEIQPDVQIENASRDVFQIHKKFQDRDIYFFTNSSKTTGHVMEATFPTDDRTPWIWNPEDGTRSLFAYGKMKNVLEIKLRPLQSLLLVFEPELGKATDLVKDERIVDAARVLPVNGSWKATFNHVDGSVFERQFEELEDYGTSTDPLLSLFAGTVVYSTTLQTDGTELAIQLDKVYRGVAEIFLNGTSIGTNWYGSQIFPFPEILQGNLTLEVRYTGILSNYCRSLDDNPVAKSWTEGFEAVPQGLGGVVRIYKK